MPAPEQGKNVVVTGGAGYIGSILVGDLLAHGYTVTVLDNLIYGGQSLLGYFSNPRFHFRRGDITGTEDVATALHGADAVVHLAAIVGDPACSRNPDLANSVNREGSRVLLREARSAGVKRFLFASTCSNYGRMNAGDGWVNEDSPLKPISLYAELKVEFEQLLLTSDDDICTTCLRFATAHGLSLRPRFDLTVNQFTAELALGRKIEVYGEQFWRPYCHVKDLAAACRMVLAAPNEKVHRRAFNVGSNSENFTKKQLVEKITQQTAASVDLVSFVHKDEDPRDYRVNCDRFQSELGFKPARSVTDTIREIDEAVRTGALFDVDNHRYRN